VIPKVRLRWRLLARAIRLKQWSKNALVLAPIALSGRLADVGAWVHGIGALVALGLVASATYLVNDIVDLADDRRHWSKRKRPLASGDLPLSVGMALVPVLGGAGFLVATFVGGAVPAIIGLYAAITLAYSARLKRIPILDVVVLAGLFTLRLFLGVMAIGAAISPWLFVFSMALFLSLSVAKRHTEVVRMIAHGLTEAAGRGYQARDEALLLAIGIASAASAIVLLTLYLTGEAFRAAFYTAPAFLWFAPGVLLLWLGRVWLLSQRGELDDDPVAFALRDGPSLLLAGVLGLAFAAASLGGLLA
jgi:4-hydroxybenzoate polyprenyltransferase